MTNATIPESPFYTLSDLCALTRFHRVTLWRRIAAGSFPPAVHRGGQAHRWLKAEVDRWVLGEWKPAEAAGVCVGR